MTKKKRVLLLLIAIPFLMFMASEEEHAASHIRQPWHFLGSRRIMKLLNLIEAVTLKSMRAVREDVNPGRAQPKASHGKNNEKLLILSQPHKKRVPRAGFELPLSIQSGRGCLKLLDHESSVLSKL